MTLLNRKRTILAKIEGTYGTDPTPTGSANAILVRNLNVIPMETDQASRDLIRAYLGNYENLPAAIHAAVEFEVEMAGGGAAATAPKYGPLLRACGFAETTVTTTESGTMQAGATSTTAVLRAALAQADDFYNGAVIRTTGGTGSGQRRLISDFVGATDTVTISKAWDTVPDNTTTYSIDAGVYYRPISDTFPSVTLYINVDGVLHELNGARGTVSMEMTVLGIPVYRFRFMGMYVAVVDGAAPTCDYSSFQKPVTVNNGNTSQFSVHGYSGILQSMSLDVANNVVFQSLVGSERVLITDRKPVGSMSIEATTVAAKNWWTAVIAATTDELTIKHGTAAGNIVEVDAFAAQLTQPTYEDLDGVAMMRSSLILVPSGGNDEIVIATK